MSDYPQGAQGGGRIRVLESTHDDGKFDKATLFLEGIPLPTGVTVWRKGALVCSAPDILYAEDTDGDGRADVVKKLFSGFGNTNPQARVNSLEYGLDGWVYGTCGLIGGRITNFAGGEPLLLRDRDFRIRPDTGEIEPVSGRTQQGRARDDWGNSFGCDNETLCLHYPLTERYLRRNPLSAPPDGAVFVPAGPNASQLFPLNPNLQLFKLTGPSGRPTAACGLGVYRDTLLGDEYSENVFVCEAVNLLVHRMPLTPHGATFTSTRSADEARSEFLASSDPWFRPVQVRTGPDGGMWVVDMHRFLIEHPRFLPPQEVAKMDVRAGADTGRIFRVRPENRDLRRWTRLDRLDTAGLVAALDSPNGWQRDMASQMLLWRADASAVAPLEKLATAAERPATRLAALCTIDGLKGLRAKSVLNALQDRHPGVRRHAIRLSEQFRDDASIIAELLSLTTDGDPQVRLQLAFSLGEWRDPHAARGLAALALRADDKYQAAAVLSSLRDDNVGEVAASVLRDLPGASARPEFVQQVMETAVALADDRTRSQILKQVAVEHPGRVAVWQWGALVGALDALQRREQPIAKLPDREIGRAIERLLTEARRTTIDSEIPEPERLAAIPLLGRDSRHSDEDLAAIAALLTPQQSSMLQQAAVTALGRIPDERAAALVLTNWKANSPTLKGTLLDFLLSRSDGLSLLLKEIAAGGIPASDLDAVRRQRLLTHKQPEIRDAAAKLFAGATSADRGKVIARYRAALELTGDRAHGKAVFGKTCSACHRLEEAGHRVGPDLEALANKSPQSLLQEILDPNRNLDGRWTVYTAVTRAGRTYSGLLASESAGSITLAGQEGKQEVLLRSDLEDFVGTGLSLMPEGLEKDLAVQDVADLLTYLTSFGPPPKQFPGNRPETIRLTGDALTLPAAKAAIYGEGILFEQEPHANVAQWRSLRDYVVWTVDLSRAADFDVWLDWACDDWHSGNTFALYGGEPTIRATTTSSGGWYKYRQEKIGAIHLESGMHRLTVRPEGDEVKRALMDLRTVYLVPPGERPQLAAAKTVAAAAPFDPAHVAHQLLDNDLSETQRKELIGKYLDKAPAIVVALTADLKPGTPEEYRRIPWIWRVAIAASRQNKPEVLRGLLDVSLPMPGQPLLDWQAVVIGGGIINAVSQLNLWPRERLAEIVKDDKSLAERWQRLLVQSAEMADNEKVPVGTRYDALRIIPLDAWEKRGAQLQKYLAKGVHDELQMGAISGISDVDRPQTAQLLLDGLGHFSAENRGIALNALLRTDQRVAALLAAIEQKKVDPAKLSSAQRKALKEHPNEKLRLQATKLLAE
jgi:putative membrane-bound dehydrogenase-like protein